MELKYYRKEHMIFGVYRGEIESFDEPRLNADGTPAINEKTGVPIIDTKSRYMPHAQEGRPNFEEIIFKGKSIGDAKRESRKLQGSPRGLGSLRVLRA